MWKKPKTYTGRQPTVGYILSVLTTNSVLVIRRASLSWNLSLSCSVPLISPFRMKLVCYCLEMVCYSDIKWLIMWRHSDWICTLVQFNSSRFRREKFAWIFSCPSLGKKENKERILHRNIVTQVLNILRRRSICR